MPVRDPEVIAKLKEAACEARKNAYVPYSGFPIGAALLGKSGKIYTGCNVENASYGGTICAERVALVKAVSEGERGFDHLVIVGPADRPVPVSPCGICRQFMAEFALDMPITMMTDDGIQITLTTAEMLPAAFTGSDIGMGAKK